MSADEVLLIADYDGCHFEIQEGRGEGFYVWRFLGDRERLTHDYSQDDIPMAKRCALHQFGVPEDAWRTLTSQQESRLRSVHNSAGMLSKVRQWFGRGPGR